LNSLGNASWILDAAVQNKIGTADYELIEI